MLARVFAGTRKAGGIRLERPPGRTRPLCPLRPGRNRSATGLLAGLPTLVTRPECGKGDTIRGVTTQLPDSVKNRSVTAGDAWR